MSSIGNQEVSPGTIIAVVRCAHIQKQLIRLNSSAQLKYDFLVPAIDFGQRVVHFVSLKCSGLETREESMVVKEFIFHIALVLRQFISIFFAYGI